LKNFDDEKLAAMAPETIGKKVFVLLGVVAGF
jgi:hypothetical protein